MFRFPFARLRSHKATGRSRVRPRRLGRGFEPLEPRWALSSVGILPAPGTPPTASFSTVPANGDVNPYGVSLVPAGFPAGGTIHAGELLVTNFNSAASGQGTGTTIVTIDPAHPVATPPVFFASTLQGTTTPPVVLKSGLVVVGNVPAGPGGTIGQGALQFIDKNGHVVKTLTNSQFLNDPWYVTADDFGGFVQLFVSNVSGKSGNFGTVTRIDMTIVNGRPFVLDMVRIASGYPTRTDSAAFVVGPGGLAFDRANDTLYVASEDSLVNGKETGSVFAIPNAAITYIDRGEGALIYADAVHLHGPMGLVLAPDGNLVTANGDAVNIDSNQPSELVEFTTRGKFVSQFSVDPSNGGAFALTFGVIDGHFSLAAVDDNTNMLEVWTVRLPGFVPVVPVVPDQIPAAIDAAFAAFLQAYP